MKLAYVTVRYGPQIVGGAEQACRQLAEHAAAVPGIDVEVHTTCATNAVTWADELAPGTTTEGGVTVHRYRSAAGRDPAFEAFSTGVLADPPRQRDDTQQRWLRLQGPVCPDAVEGALGAGADLILATPYLYWPTVETARRARRPLVLHPAAHDEAPIRLPVFETMFASAGGLAYYTDGERRLVERLWPALAATPQLVAGLGIDPAPDVSRSPRLWDRPYMLYLGRVDDGKSASVLGRFFAAYKRRRPGPLALVFAGPVVHPPEEHPDVIVAGPLTESEKWSALAGAEIFVHPSANESFGIVLLEAWSVGRPALVNARCPATAEHVRRSRGGLAYGGYAAFETALDRLLADPETASRLGDSGREYVAANFSWPVVTERYMRFLESVVSHRAAAGVN